MKNVSQSVLEERRRRSLSQVQTVAGKSLKYGGKPVQYSSALSAKMLNLFWANQKLDMIIAELSKDKSRNPELIQASQLLEIAKTLISNYSDRLRREQEDDNPADDRVEVETDQEMAEEI